MKSTRTLRPEDPYTVSNNPPRFRRSRRPSFGQEPNHQVPIYIIPFSVPIFVGTYVDRRRCRRPTSTVVSSLIAGCKPRRFIPILWLCISMYRYPRLPFGEILSQGTNKKRLAC
ncbi:hypothetical protein M413DRAFT_244683 [Hebeloma cylindrosporum]|uniref:Uncharacterized protein n=1 Tax=Hebeloma cylindrosporum TaxID=76867 RepID=A0A0C3C405_HEBCY|nr:hypothetical protein M413DRAFT_244683 [Hebeloma cylindrosporum h7]